MFNTYYWVSFFIFIAIVLAIDLGLLNRRPKVPSFSEAAYLTFFWILLATLFSALIYGYTNAQKTLEFATGYLVELSLSMDNVFVFALLFRYFKVDIKFQHRVLFWGVIGAIGMRFIMITGGIYLIDNFKWIFYFFGALLIFSAIKISFYHSEGGEPEDNQLIKFLKKYLNLTDQYHGDKFLIIENGKRYFTPLFLVLVLVEKTDLVFAMDSIPAILAITQDSFIVFTSNIFAILGLRSLYFLLANIMDRFIYLKYGLGVILAYVGVKMILVVQGFHIPTLLSLTVIILSISISIMVSLFKTRGISNTQNS